MRRYMNLDYIFAAVGFDSPGASYFSGVCLAQRPGA